MTPQLVPLPGPIGTQFPAVQVISARDALDEIQPADIMICSGRSADSVIIEHVTDCPWCHVAMFWPMEMSGIKTMMVIEAVGGYGVRMYPIENMMVDFDGTGQAYPGRILVARHRDMAAVIADKGQLNCAYNYSTALLGHKYDDGEIARIAARFVRTIFGDNAPVNIDFSRPEYICSVEAAAVLHLIGIQIQPGPLGITPKDFALDPNVEPVFEIEVG